LKKIISVVVILGLLTAGFYLYKKVYKRAGLPVITVQRQNGDRLVIDGKPFLVKGVCYSPIPVGKDYEYNFWGDPNKPWITDGKLMKAAGINTVRFYRPGKNPAEVNQVLTDLNQKFGIRALMGHYLGFWDWPPPNYADEVFREKVRSEVMEMVKLYKDNPGVLMWVLGNENNYSFDRNIQNWSNDAIDALPDRESQRKEKARIYYSYVNSLAKDIKKIDSRHPVVMGVGEVTSLDLAKEECPDIDVLGVIAYRGSSFGNLFRQVKQKFDLPVVMIEWGADSFNAFSREPDEEAQAEFLKLQWQDIERNSRMKKGVGNCLGGTLFEWTDEWWKGNENLPYTWTVQDTAAHWYNASYYYDDQASDRLNMNEEWWGVVSLNPKKTVNGIHERIPKKSYSVLQSLWVKKT
jgi:beta-galactosidase